MKLIEEYIKSKRLAWSPTTLRSEEARLNSLVQYVDQNPEEVYLALKATMKPYTIKTAFVRLGEFYQWLMESGHKRVSPPINPFKKFMGSHANLFKYVYQTEQIEITYEEAFKRIGTIESRDLRLAALQLLEGGLRSCELERIDGKQVIGKGGKPREVYLSHDLKKFRFQGTYAQLYYALKKVGLKPHTLRKLCASKLGRLEGVTLVDLMAGFGWSDPKTATIYQQAQRQEAMNNSFKKVRGE